MEKDGLEEPTNKDILYNAREIALKKGIKNP